MNIFTTKVKKFIFLTNKIQKVLFDQGKNNVFYEKSVVAVRTGGTEKEPVEVLVSLDFKNFKEVGAKFNENDKLTAYDGEIHNAVISLYDSGNQYFSPNMILNVLSGNKEYNTGRGKSATKNNQSKVILSLDKMRNTSIKIDASGEGRAFHKDDYQYSGNLLPFNFESGVSLNNNLVTNCIHLLRSPPLLEYSRLRKQLTTVNIDLLEVLSNRILHILIRDYLLKEILWMKYSRSRKRVIRYDTLQKSICVEFLGTSDVKNHKIKILRDNVKKCLEYWVSKNFIKGYSEEKERNIISKVIISL